VVLATELYVRWGFWLLAVPVAAVFLLISGGSLPALIMLVLGAEAVFNFGIILALRRRGFPFSMGLGGLLRLVVWHALVAAALVGSGSMFSFDFPLSVTICLVLGAIGTIMAKPLNTAEAAFVSEWSPRWARLLSRLPAG
jgi:hypothetical protein